MRRIALAAALICALAVQAKEWTLQQCMDYAVENNLTVLSRDIERQNAELAVTEARDGVLPTISGSVSQNWSFGRGLTANNTYDNNNTSNFSPSIGLNLPLFQGLQNVRQVKYARTYLTSVVEGLEATKDDVALQVMAQYLQVLYAQEVETIAKAQLELTSEEYKRRQVLLEAGKIPEADMLDAKAQEASARLQLVTSHNDVELALLDLTQLLRLQSYKDFQVVSPSETEMNPTIMDPDQVYKQALTLNHNIASEVWQVKAAEDQISVAKTGWIPKLSFNAGLGTNYYHVGGMDNDGFGAQMRHNFSQYVGLSLSVPIFDAFSTRNSVRRAEAAKLSAELQLETGRDNLYKAIQQSYRQAIGAREKLASAAVATESAAASLAAIKEKYGLGRATPIEFDNARNQHFQAQCQQAQARYELYLRARILAFYASGR